MSQENSKTLEVYEHTAGRYMANTVEHDNLDPAKAKRKRAKLNKFIRDSFATLPERAHLFEIGSADGENAKYLEELGYDVVASDVAPAFLNRLDEENLFHVKFDAVKDPFQESYDGIFCWRVFVHFTPEDALTVLKKTYDALEPGGRFVFNAMNRDAREVDEEWVDFPGEYHMGADRYYKYFREEELRDLIAKTDYRVISYHQEGGDAGNKWHVFVLEK